MNFQFTPAAKQLILNQNAPLIAAFKTEECYVCSGHRQTTYPTAHFGFPDGASSADYIMIIAEDITVYVQSELYHFDPSILFAVDVAGVHQDRLTLSGVAIR